MNGFDDCGGPLASDMQVVIDEREAARALLAEARPSLRILAHHVAPGASWSLEARDLLARIDALLAEGEGDG